MTLRRGVRGSEGAAMNLKPMLKAFIPYGKRILEALRSDKEARRSLVLPNGKVLQFWTPAQAYRKQGAINSGSGQCVTDTVQSLMVWTPTQSVAEDARFVQQLRRSALVPAVSVSVNDYTGRFLVDDSQYNAGYVAASYLSLPSSAVHVGRIATDEPDVFMLAMWSGDAVVFVAPIRPDEQIFGNEEEETGEATGKAGEMGSGPGPAYTGAKAEAYSPAERPSASDSSDDRMDLLTCADDLERAAGGPLKAWMNPNRKNRMRTLVADVLGVYAMKRSFRAGSR